MYGCEKNFLSSNLKTKKRMIVQIEGKKQQRQEHHKSQIQIHPLKLPSHIAALVNDKLLVTKG
jgi:hypothetical protein